MSKQLEIDFFNSFNKQLFAVYLIKENKYCSIFGAQLDSQAVIIKSYREPNSKLAAIEADSFDFYHKLTQMDSTLIPGKTLFHDQKKSLLCLSFIPGDRLSEVIYRSIWKTSQRDTALSAMSKLGEFLSMAHEESKDSTKQLDPFYFEYLEHCSKKLSLIFLAGNLLFKNTMQKAQSQIEALKKIKVTPAFAHRDFVFFNIHINKDRVGIIDFANSQFNGHLLDDYYCLLTTLNTMVMPKKYKTQLWNAFTTSLKVPTFSPVEHEFFQTFHKYRWFWLRHLNGLTHQWARNIMGNINKLTPSCF